MMSDRRAFTVGLDLGQARDFTALAVLERAGNAQHIPHLERMPLGTPYPGVIDRVAMLLATPPLASSFVTLVVDETGVGRPVVELIQRDPRVRCRVLAVTITAGLAVTEDRVAGRFTVPKRELVSAVQALLQTGRLLLARELAEADTLVRELLAFQIRVTAAANDQYGVWREGTHDDLVLAVALAAWHVHWSRRNTLRVRLWGGENDQIAGASP